MENFHKFINDLQARIAELEQQLAGRGEAVLYQQRNYHARDGWMLWHQIHKETYDTLIERLAGNRVLRNNFEVRALYTAPPIIDSWYPETLDHNKEKGE